MVPLAMLAGGRYATGPLSEHSRTNMGVIGLFGIAATTEPDGTVRVGTLTP